MTFMELEQVTKYNSNDSFFEWNKMKRFDLN